MLLVAHITVFHAISWIIFAYFQFLTVFWNMPVQVTIETSHKSWYVWLNEKGRT